MKTLKLILAALVFVSMSAFGQSWQTVSGNGFTADFPATPEIQRTVSQTNQVGSTVYSVQTKSYAVMVMVSDAGTLTLGDQPIASMSPYQIAEHLARKYASAGAAKDGINPNFHIEKITFSGFEAADVHTTVSGHVLRDIVIVTKTTPVKFTLIQIVAEYVDEAEPTVQRFINSVVLR